MGTNKLKIDEESIIVKNNQIDDADLDGEKVMMNIEKGRYFAMNEVGSRIWTLIDQPKSIKDIINSLLQEYAVDYENCKIEVIKFINNLYNAELVKVN